jgi:hypothetical protein
VRLDPAPISLAEEGDGAQHGGKDELDRPVSEMQQLVNNSLGLEPQYEVDDLQNRVHLANKLHPDRKSGLRHGTAKLEVRQPASPPGSPSSRDRAFIP